MICGDTGLLLNEIAWTVQSIIGTLKSLILYQSYVIIENILTRNTLDLFGTIIFDTNWKFNSKLRFYIYFHFHEIRLLLILKTLQWNMMFYKSTVNLVFIEENVTIKKILMSPAKNGLSHRFVNIQMSTKDMSILCNEEQ